MPGPATGKVNTTAIATRRTTGRLGWTIFVIAALGLVLSCVSLVSHYRKSPSQFCDFNATFNCDMVNRGPFSEIAFQRLRIPVAGIGIAGYALLMVLARLAYDRRASLVMLLGGIGGLGFSLHLTHIEAQMQVWCILCLGSLAAISLITLLSGWQTARVWKA